MNIDLLFLKEGKINRIFTEARKLLISLRHAHRLYLKQFVFLFKEKFAIKEIVYQPSNYI